MRATRSLVVVPLVVALAACGGGGGGGDDAADDVTGGGGPAGTEAEQVAEEGDDLDEFCGLIIDLFRKQDATTPEVEQLLDLAPAELADDVEVLLDFARARDEGGDAAVAALDGAALAQAGEAIQTYTVESCGADDLVPDGPPPVLAPLPVPLLDNDRERFEATACEAGDMAACDRLYAMTDLGSVGEDYGSTCGRRLALADELRGACEATYGPVAPVPTTTTTEAPPATEPTTTTATTAPPTPDVPPTLGPPTPPPASDDEEIAELGQSCFEGDMGACDELYRSTPFNSAEETYGETCGGRLGADDATPNRCRSTFGSRVG